MQYHHRDGPNPFHPAGETRKPHSRVDFDQRLKPELHGSKITSDAGFLAYRELDKVLGLTDLGGAVLSDLRRGKNRRDKSRSMRNQRTNRFCNGNLGKGWDSFIQTDINFD